MLTFSRNHFLICQSIDPPFKQLLTWTKKIKKRIKLNMIFKSAISGLSI